MSPIHPTLLAMLGCAVLAAAPARAADQNPAGVARHQMAGAHRMAHRHPAPAPASAATSSRRAGLPPGGGYLPAPMPNLDIAAPSRAVAPRIGVNPAVFKVSHPDVGDGYVYGSSPQAMDDAREYAIPGLLVRIPFR